MSLKIKICFCTVDNNSKALLVFPMYTALLVWFPVMNFGVKMHIEVLASCLLQVT